MKNAKSLPAPPAAETPPGSSCTAFAGCRYLASGPLTQVARRVKAVVDPDRPEPVLVFDDLTGEVIDVDLRGTVDEVVERLTRLEPDGAAVVGAPQRRGPGRPKLGVISREVTLLPGQWDWLDAQPNGASAAVRRLVYEAKRSSQEKDRARQAQEAVYRFMTTMAGDFPGFEEALRAFYRREYPRLAGLVKAWPKDVQRHVKKLVAVAKAAQAAGSEKNPASANG